jgi:hypothetical protein
LGWHILGAALFFLRFCVLPRFAVEEEEKDGKEMLVELLQ